MLKATVIFSALLWLATACGSNATSSQTSGDGNQTTPSTTDDSNGLFVIAPIDNNVVISPNIAGPQVANFTVADTVSYQYAIFGGVAGLDATIVLNSTANACGDANGNAYHVGETQLVINISDLPDMTVINANTYVFPAAADAPYEIASATYAVVGAPCQYNSTSLVSGQVTITDVQPGSLSGNYNLTFASGSVSGTFTNAPSCTPLSVTPATAPVCN